MFSILDNVMVLLFVRRGNITLPEKSIGLCALIYMTRTCFSSGWGEKTTHCSCCPMSDILSSFYCSFGNNISSGNETLLFFINYIYLLYCKRPNNNFVLCSVHLVQNVAVDYLLSTSRERMLGA